MALYSWASTMSPQRWQTRLTWGVVTRSKRVPVAIVELREEATRRFVRREMRRAYSAEPAARCLTAEKQLARATLRRELLALLA